MNEPVAPYVKLSVVKTDACMVQPLAAQPADHVFVVTSDAAEEQVVCHADGTVAVRGIDGQMHDVDPVAATWIRKGVALYGQALGIVQGP